jgi:hypothetical protein
MTCGTSQEKKRSSICFREALTDARMTTGLDALGTLLCAIDHIVLKGMTWYSKLVGFSAIVRMPVDLHGYGQR